LPADIADAHFLSQFVFSFPHQKCNKLSQYSICISKCPFLIDLFSILSCFFAEKLKNEYFILILVFHQNFLLFFSKTRLKVFFSEKHFSEAFLFLIQKNS